MFAIQTTLISAAFSLSVLGATHLAMIEEARASEAAPEAMARATRATVALDIGGMITPDCPERIKRALSDQAGILAVSASLEDRSATVRYDPRRTSVAAIKRRIEAQTPFTATESGK